MERTRSGAAGQHHAPWMNYHQQHHLLMCEDSIGVPQLQEGSRGCQDRVLATGNTLLDMLTLDGLGAAGFESWKSGLVWSCSHGHLLVSPCRSVKEGQTFRVQTLFSKLCCSRFTTALLSSKTGRGELIKVRLYEI